MASRKLHIIVYEDDPTLGSMLSMALRQQGHKVDTYEDPSFCPTYKDLESECPHRKPCADVIITDHNMPNITGVEYLSLQQTHGCKIKAENKAIVTGAVMNPETQERIDSLGCRLFRKPFRLVEILQWIDECSDRLKN